MKGHPNLCNIEANLNTFKCIINIRDPNVKVYFSEKNSVGPLLGFGKNILEGEGSFESSNIVNILKNNSLHVHCSVIEGSNLNDERKLTIYSFFPYVPPG